MILHTDEDLQGTRELLERGHVTLSAQRDALLRMGATPFQAERALEPMRCFVGDLEDQVAAYEATSPTPTEETTPQEKTS